MMKRILPVCLIVAVGLAALMLTGCGAKMYTVTVTPSGTDTAFSSTGDLYIALAKGAFSFASTKPAAADVVAVKKITPGTGDALTFSVEGAQNYTAFAFFDVNGNGAYDSDTDVSTGVTFSDLAYLEEDVAVTLSYYY